MKFPKECKLHLATSKDESARHLGLSRVCLDKAGEQPALMATDGRILARVEVEAAEEDRAGLIPAEAIQAACAGVRKGDSAQVHRNGQVTVQTKTGQATFPCPGEDENFPQFAASIIPAPREYSIVVNVKLLANLAAAMGGEAVQLHLDPQDPKACIRVEPMGCDKTGRHYPIPGRVGAIMPVRMG